MMKKSLLSTLLALLLAVSSFAATFETLGATTASSEGTTITCGDDAKGSYTQFSASTSNDWEYVYILVSQESAALVGFLLDISTGAAASEVVQIPDLYIDTTIAENPVAMGPYRLDISSGTRVAARCESTDVSGAETLELIIYGATSYLPDLTSPGVETSGNVNASGVQKATAVDPGGTANTKGSWVELDASAPSDAEHFWIHIGRRANFTFGADDTWLVDIAIGAVSSETVHVENLRLGIDQFDDFINPQVLGPFPEDGLQSQRVSARAQSSGTDATDRILGMTIVYGTGTPVTGGGGSGGVMPMGGLIKR